MEKTVARSRRLSIVVVKDSNGDGLVIQERLLRKLDYLHSLGWSDLALSRLQVSK